MRLLLDTHIFLWVLAGAKDLKSAQRRIIQEADEVFVSAASMWEIAIKTRIGKLHVDSAEMSGAIEGCGFIEMPVLAVHAAAVATMTIHHNDPFDHLLVAQAMTEPLKLLTTNAILRKYSDVVILV